MSEIMIVKQYNPELRGIILSEAELIVRNTLLRYGEGRELTDSNIETIRGPFIQDVGSRSASRSGSGEYQIHAAGSKEFIKFFLSQAKGSDIGGKWKKRVIIAPTATVARIVPGGFKNMSAADPSEIYHVMGLASAVHSYSTRDKASEGNAARAAASYVNTMRRGTASWFSRADPAAAVQAGKYKRGSMRASAVARAAEAERLGKTATLNREALNELWASRTAAAQAVAKASVAEADRNRRGGSRGGSRRTRKRRYQ